MGLKVYLPLAVVVFLAATTGADLVTKTTIAGMLFDAALRDHFQWVGRHFVGSLYLLAPFIAVALICARVEKKVRSRSTIVIFALAMLTLLYFHFITYEWEQRALVEGTLIGASLAKGLLTVAIEVPVVLAVIVAGALATKFDRRMSD